MSVAGQAFRLTLLLLMTGSAANAWQAPPPEALAEPAPQVEANSAAATAAIDDAEEIVVTGQRPPGAVLGDIKPEVQLGIGDIRARGVSSLADLLSDIAPQTGGGRGRDGGAPVILLNGRRITGFAEIRDLPSEAVVRVEVYPEELALKYGFRADQKVVNFILRQRFRAITAEAVPTIATAGGRQSGRAEVNQLRIDKAGRTTINLQYQHDSPLREAERDIAPPLSGSLDQRRFRSLLARSDRVGLNGTVNRTILGDVSATLNAMFEATDSRSGLGATLAADALTPVALLRDTTGATGHVGVGLNGTVGDWLWTFTNNFDINRSLSFTDRSVTVRDRVRTITQANSSELVANGSLFRLPAGEVSTSLKAGFDVTSLEGKSERSGLVQARALDRDIVRVQGNLDLPIAKRASGVLAALGTLSANLNLAADLISDVGTLTTIGGGLVWSPVKPIDVIASYSEEEGAPTMQQLGNPQLVTPNVRLFDFVRGTTAIITRIDGGNPALTPDTRSVAKLSLTGRPLGNNDLSVTATYTDAVTRNFISSFPTPTVAIEAAFPGRFVRDAGGQLISFDSRPVNFSRARQRQLRWGFNFSKRLGPAPTPGAFDALRGAGRPQGGAAAGSGGPNRPAAQPGTGGAAPGGPPRTGGDGPRAGGFGGGGARGTRVQFALYHNWRLRDDILIRPGVPRLDLLDGDATGGNGGQPRHEVELQAGLTRNGIGTRLTGNWRSATRVRGVSASPGDNSGDIFFDSHTTFGVRLFADLGQQRKLAKDRPWLRGLRVSLAIDNLFDNQPNVRGATGATPVNFQPALLDPLGRTLRVSIRKLFF